MDLARINFIELNKIMNSFVYDIWFLVFLYVWNYFYFDTIKKEFGDQEQFSTFPNDANDGINERKTYKNSPNLNDLELKT